MIHESDLKRLLLEYDKEHGAYPESCFEGHAVWDWLNERLKTDAWKTNSVTDQDEWEKELGRMPRERFSNVDTY
jgi:hypothetical protein